jgi:hypothetical protein
LRWKIYFLFLVTTNNLENKIRIENKQAVVHVVGEDAAMPILDLQMNQNSYR